MSILGGVGGNIMSTWGFLIYSHKYQRLFKFWAEILMWSEQCFESNCFHVQVSCLRANDIRHDFTIDGPNRIILSCI